MRSLSNLFGRAAPTLDTAAAARAFTESDVLAVLDASERERLGKLAQRFLAAIRVDAAGGLELVDDMRSRIALEACLPILELELSWYRRVSHVLVYPEVFRVAQNWTDDDGIVHDRDAELIGEAWDGGPVILAWEDIERPVPGTNVVIHEFAHVLDALNGRTNGFPPMVSAGESGRWTRAFADAFADHRRRVERDEEVCLDDYAAEDEAEFFAVATETFFMWPENIAEGYPNVYGALCDFFRQDPLRRCGGESEPEHLPRR